MIFTIVLRDFSILIVFWDQSSRNLFEAKKSWFTIARIGIHHKADDSILRQMVKYLRYEK